MEPPKTGRSSVCTKDPSGSNFSNGTTYKTINIYVCTTEGEVYFKSDISNLVKTIKKLLGEIML